MGNATRWALQEALALLGLAHVNTTRHAFQTMIPGNITDFIVALAAELYEASVNSGATSDNAHAADWRSVRGRMLCGGPLAAAKWLRGVATTCRDLQTSAYTKITNLVTRPPGPHMLGGAPTRNLTLELIRLTSRVSDGPTTLLNEINTALEFSNQKIK